ncbi:hypothetical protein HJC23_005280 [Cyclotella cryptica]|uniref:Uncharacterized protein n=1 Tax=Cyclotella cryptica TaxID=29204 RepID=A0ABD3P3H6_9STRA|eukprot:CCRYP_017739-RB/>CCRYP_017739-RB protein AED:0.23 eAED:0.23 QI:53/1/1/1/0.6/0.5/6/1213/1586
MDNNNGPHRSRDPRYSSTRTPLKHNPNTDDDAPPRDSRGYAGYSTHSHHRPSNRAPAASPSTSTTASFSYSSLAEPASGGRGSGSFGHYGQHRRDAGYRRGSTSATWDTSQHAATPSQKEHHQRERDKEREMMSIYGRGGEDALPSVVEEKKKYHNPCRFAGHDHDWRDCPNNFRNKGKHRGSGTGFGMSKYHGSGDYKTNKEGGESVSGISKSTSWGGGGGDYYGPASETSGGGSVNASDRGHDSSVVRGYSKPTEKTSHDLPLIGSRSKSFGAETTSRGAVVDRADRGFDVDNESLSGPADSQHSPVHASASSGERKWQQYNSRTDRNYYSPGPVSKPRPSPTPSVPSNNERGYSSMSFTPLSTGGPRRRSVQINPSIPHPPFNRSQSSDSGGMRDKREGEDAAADTSFYRRLAMANSSSSIENRDSMEGERVVADKKSNVQLQSSGHVPESSPNPNQTLRQEEESRAHPSVQEKTSKVCEGNEEVTTGCSQQSRTSSKVESMHEVTPTPLATPTKQLPNKEEEKSPSLTCAELGAAEKVAKAEEIVSKMNALMNKTPIKSTSAFKHATCESVVPLPTKNEILKCMAVIDGRIKIKDDDASSVKKQLKAIEQELILEEERLIKEEEEKRQSLIQGVASRRTERESSVQEKEGNLAKLVDRKKSSMEEERKDELLQFEKDCTHALKANAAKLNSEISLAENQVEEAELMIEEMDVPPPSSAQVDASPDFVDESDFVSTLDAPGKMTNLIASVLEDNQRIAAEAHQESLAAIPFFPKSQEDANATRNSPTSVVSNEEWSNRARKVTGLADALYTEPADVPMFHENNQTFLEIAPQIKECIRSKKQKLKKRWEDLANQYLVRQMIYNEETGVNTETSERGGFFSITGRIDESGDVTSSVRGNNPYRRPRRGVSPGDVVRSEYEQEQIIAELAAKEAMEKRIKEGGCALPHQRGVLENSLFASFSNGFLGNRVDDFVKDEEERRNINVWTDMEKCIFFDRFLHHPKDFRKISSFLRNKTTKDCIEFYYNSKKTIPYKHALKEFLQRKKRHGTVVGWDATIQAALSIGATIKPGESPEKPLRFNLPESDYSFRTHQFHPMRLEVFNNLESIALHTKHHEETSKKQKRSNWFILDASSRKYIKQNKDDKENHASKRKSITLQNAEKEETSLSTGQTEAAPKKVQRTADMEAVHPSQPAASEEKKAPVKSQKWKTEEKKLFFEAVEKFGHNWGQVSEYVGTRSMSQVKNYFYDNKKQASKKKDKAEKSIKSGSIAETTQETVIDTKKKNAKENDSSKIDNGTSSMPSDTSSQQKSEEDTRKSPRQNAAETDAHQSDVGICLPVSQKDDNTSAEEQYCQQLLLEQQNQHFIQQKMNLQMQQHHQHELLQQQQHQEMIQERLLHHQMQMMHDAQRLQEAQRIEDARQWHQEEIIRQQQEEMIRQQQHQQWAQFQQQIHRHNGNEWVDQQQIHNLQSLLALHREQSPMNPNNFSVHQANIVSRAGYHGGNGNGQPLELERILHSRMAAAAAAGIPQSSLEAAIALQGNDGQSQQQRAANLELLHRLAQQHQQQSDGHSYGGVNNGYPHFRQGGR